MTAPLILVIAGRGDTAAIGFAADAGSQVRLMTPADLSQPGWSFDVSGTSPSVAVIAGERVSAAAMAGVLTRLPAVGVYDLPHIIAADRAYLAAEMTAFLLAWLTSLRGVVVNRPSAQCLSGPHWRREQWIMAANRLGIPAVPVSLLASRVRQPRDASEPTDTTSIVVIGRHHVGTADPVLVTRAHALAQAAGVELLSVQFDGDGASARFVAASLWPDLGDKRVADAVLRLMWSRSSARGDLQEAG